MSSRQVVVSVNVHISRLSRKMPSKRLPVGEAASRLNCDFENTVTVLGK
jgi:hypothetical protein